MQTQSIVDKIDGLIISLDAVNDGLLIGMLEFKKKEFHKTELPNTVISKKDFLNAKKGLRCHLNSELISKNKRLEKLSEDSDVEYEYYNSNGKLDEYYALATTIEEKYFGETEYIQNQISHILDSGEYDHAIELKALINNLNKKLTKILKP